MISIKSTVLPAAILASSLGTAAYADINMQEGLWEISNKIELTGMPIQINIKEQKITQCLDKQKIVPQTDKKINKYCTISEQKVSGNTVTWKMSCKGNMHSEGKATYNGDTFTGEMTTVTDVPKMGQMSAIIHMKGKRIGECKKN